MPVGLLGKKLGQTRVYDAKGVSTPVTVVLAGPNHVLPTGGTARFSSPLGVYDFIKRSSLICLSPEGLRELSRPAMCLAGMEKLEGHAQSVRKRAPADSSPDGNH